MCGKERRDAPRKLGEGDPDGPTHSGAQRCVLLLRHFEAKKRSWTTEYQCPAMSSALPAIENVISSIVTPDVGSRTTVV